MINNLIPRRALCAALILIMAALSLALPGTADPPHQEPMPDLLWSPTIQQSPNPVPMFVRIDRVLRPDGTLDTDLFSEGGELGIRTSYLNDLPAKEPCRQTHSPGDPYNAPELHWHDFRSVIEDSDVIVVTRVTGVAAGFMHERAGSLARLKPMQWLKGQDTWETKYLFFPVADITLGGKTFCVTHAQYSEAPEVHDRVLVAYRNTPADREWPLFIGPAPRFLVLRPQGGAKLPPWVRQKHSEWTGEPTARIIGDIQRIIHQSRNEQP